MPKFVDKIYPRSFFLKKMQPQLKFFTGIRKFNWKNLGLTRQKGLFSIN